MKEWDVVKDTQLALTTSFESVLYSYRREALLDLVINVMSEAAAKGLPVAGIRC